MDTQNQLTDNEVLELVELIELSHFKLSQIDNLEAKNHYLLGLHTLRIPDIDLTVLPSSIGKLTRLTELSIICCKNLTTLPESIGNLKQLKVLNLFKCEKLTTLPESIGNLKQLEKLDLSECKNLKTLPKSIGNLKQLKVLNLFKCEELTTLPESLGNLTQLTKLNLRECEKLEITTPLKITKSNLDNISLMSIGNIFYRQGYLQQAKEYYLEVKHTNPFFYQDDYFIAQIKLTLIYTEEKNWNEVNKCFDNIKRTHKEYYVQQVINQIQEIQDNDQKIYLFNILLSFFHIRENLLVGNSIYEKTFAHYAKPDVAMILLDEQNKFQIASTEQVNDPKEGKVIFDYFNHSEKLKEQQVNLTPLNILSTFLGCFTFNHDSLNQFRLYGKEDNKEATGVSIVLNNNFFNYQHDKTLQSEKQTKDSNNDTDKDKLPLYRCIYLDPEGKLNNQPYIQVACRDKLTFYREKNRNQNDWDEYQEYINNIQGNIMKQFAIIETNICELFANVNSIEEKEQLIKTVSFILLPLSFMVKHSAYKEEQECRIFRFVAPDDKEIKVAPASKRMYIEYSQSMSKYVNKMYLSPGAEKYRNIFNFLIKKVQNKIKNQSEQDFGFEVNKIEIRSSKNPFR